MYNGIVNVYKEAGFTSFDVVAKLRGVFGQKKIGHTGTLDPDAVGVLPICLGSATKVCDLLTDRSKTYVATMHLGIVTDTQDMSGSILRSSDEYPSEEMLREAILSFIGEYEQVPPMYSALKVNGKKLYELAREGKTVERKARPVRIDDIKILEVKIPLVKMEVSCSKGTYIRTLCEDIGEKLSCGACMEHLLRKRVGEFEVSESVTIAELQRAKEEGRLSEYVLEADRLFLQYPAFTVKEEDDRFLLNGNRLTKERFENAKEDAFGSIRVYRSNGSFFAIYEYDREREDYKPVKIFKGQE